MARVKLRNPQCTISLCVIHRQVKPHSLTDVPHGVLKAVNFIKATPLNATHFV
jgi:hypothetical protein